MASGKGHGVLGPRASGVLICLIIIVPLGLGFLFQARMGGEWHWDDWASIILSILLGLGFFLLARLVDRENERVIKDIDSLSKTRAHAALHTTIGALKTTGVRNASGAQEHALRVSADALAALEYFDRTEDEDLRRRLMEEIEAAYSNLAFGALSRGTWLPKSTWSQIKKGAEEVKAKLEELGASQQNSLKELVDHVTCIVETASELRSKGFSATTPDAPELVPQLQVEELGCLYRNELTVIRNWNVLHNGNVACFVELVKATATKDWYTPWYVTRLKGEWKPVNVIGKELEEEAAWDKIEYKGKLPKWPTPLKVREVPPGMRERAIQRMMDLIEQENSGVVSALVYELADAKARTILDGNHRVVAAIRLAAAIQQGNRPHGPFAAGAAGPNRIDRAEGPFVLAYVIKEKDPITTKLTSKGWEDCERTFRLSKKDWEDCEGFTPDVWRLREAFKQGKISDRRRYLARLSKWRRSGTI